MATIDPAQLNRRVVVLRRVLVSDPQWGDSYEWLPHRTVWGAIKYDSADEEFAAGQTYARRVVTFTLRFTRDLTAVDRLECENVTCDILGIREIGFRDGLEVKAEATDPGAQQ